MNKLLSCHFNMDTNRMEARFEGSTTIAGTTGGTGLAALQ